MTTLSNERRRLYLTPRLFGALFLLGLTVRDENERGWDEDYVVEGPFHIRFYAALPLREASRLWGYLNSLTVPVWLREPLYGFYSRMFGCNLDEMEQPDLKEYRNLGEFFYRKLKEGARIMESELLVSPVDGKVLSFGPIETRRISQVKGVSYSMDALLGRRDHALGNETSETSSSRSSIDSGIDLKSRSSSPAAVKDFADLRDPSAEMAPLPGKRLYQCVIYLAPGDYHRFHSPTDWAVQTRRHFAGELLSVSPMIVEKIRNLFVLNERVVLSGKWKHGYFSMIPVGATNVGNIKIDFDPNLETNQPINLSKQPIGFYSEKVFTSDKSNGHYLSKGDQMGGFKLGSTIVLVFEAPESFSFALKNGQKVKVGERLGSM
ncbi:phosphatidylserine decarboxylase 1 [Blyttiomyces sp. JEL0837]|nr:phosphatidylserine decarboxylase 1 [Blyttiomyces sp. JEL0837]